MLGHSAVAPWPDHVRSSALEEVGVFQDVKNPRPIPPQHQLQFVDFRLKLLSICHCEGEVDEVDSG
jgi:hypothetical protein